jgi:hypothetical protein
MLRHCIFDKPRAVQGVRTSFAQVFARAAPVCTENSIRRRRSTRFKPGNNVNPEGRRKRKPVPIADIIDNVLNGFAEYRERGRTKKARRRELTIKTHVRLALGGNLKSIETILLLRAHAQTSIETGVQRFEVADWMPDYPGQTGEQKTREFATQANAEIPAWWKDAETKTEDTDK